MIKQDLKKVMRKVVERYPELSQASKKKIDFSKKDVISAASDNDTLYFNPKYFKGLSEEERIGVVAFILTESQLRLVERAKDKNLDMWTLACNATIIEKLRQDGLKLPKEGISFKEAKDKTVDEVYEVLQGLGRSFEEIVDEASKNKSIQNFMEEEKEI